MGREPATGVAAALLAAAALSVGAAPAAAQVECDSTIRLVTRPGDIARAVPDADGSVVAFTSQADALAGRRANPWNGVFRLRRGSSRPALLSPRNRHADYPAISADGSRVAFTAGDAGAREVYVHDATSGATTLVSRASGVGGRASGYAEVPAISADGARVAFATPAALDPADDNGQVDAYLRDLRTHETIWVSRGGRARAEQVAIDADGSRVAFVTEEGSFGGGGGDREQVFVRDLSAAATILVSRAGPDGPPADFNAFGPSMDAEGNRVAFTTGAENLGPRSHHLTDVFVRDIKAGTTELVSRGDGADGPVGDSFSLAPTIDGAGTRVAFESLATSLDGVRNAPRTAAIYVRDLRTLDTTLVAEDAKRPEISADGSAITFRQRFGEVWNLVARDADGVIRVLAPGGDPPPDSSIRRVGRRVIKGTATRAARVEVGVVRRRVTGTLMSYEWLDRSGRWRRTESGRCPGWIWTRANGTRRWVARLPRRLARGRYVVYSRARSTAGEREDRFDSADRNRVVLRIR